MDYLKNKYKKVSNTSHAIFRDILSLSDYKWLIVTNVRHGSNYAFALAVFRAPFFSGEAKGNVGNIELQNL